MIILHIGMPKTGTSSLQHSLALHTRYGGTELVYPQAGRAGSVGHHALAIAVATRGVDIPEVDELVELAANATAPVVISSEAFNGVKVPIMSALVGRLATVGEVRVLMAYREMASFLESMYLQGVRTGLTTVSFNQYLNLRVRNWLGIYCWLKNRFDHVAALRHALGERLVLKLVVPQFNALETLAEAAGVPANVLLQHQAKLPRNEKRSLKTQITMLNLKAIQRRIGRPVDRRLLLQNLQRTEFAGDLQDYTVMSKRQFQAVGRRARGWAERSGFHEYVAAFPESQPRTKHYAQLDLRCLSDADMTLLKRLVERIEQTRSASRTAKQA